MKRLFSFLAVLGIAATSFAQNRFLDTGNQFFSITNYGPGPATLSNMTALPLGTWPEASSSGEAALKVIVINPVTTGTSDTIVVTGTSRTFAPSTLTTSGSFGAGLKSIDLSVIAGTFSFITTSGTVTLTSGQTFARAVAPDVWPVISYTISAGGTTQAITTK